MALLSRFYPDPATDGERKDFNKLALAAERHNPGLADEMRTDQLANLRRLGGAALKLPTWNFLHVGGPICTRAVNLFGAKLALALHYEATQRIVPSGGVIVLNRFSNVDAFTDEHAIDALQMFGAGKTLQMGKFEVSNQFRYSSVHETETNSMSAHVAVFREAMALMMVVCHKTEDVPDSVSGHFTIV
ncbi:hypothetical protein ELH86_24920 [Rhizobium ruizarguesonis]|nr:hypothetical protein ELH86_24920 [Rhizobium ruizarguesonis]